jgi:cysteine desulfurase
VGSSPIYLDYAATTPLDPEVFAAMRPFLEEHFANPSSLHAPGRRARRAVEEARERVAAAIGATPREILFTSGATEADNHALRAATRLNPGGHIVTSLLEHSAVLTTVRALEGDGHPVTYLSPNDKGEISPESLREVLREDTALIALMYVNNETGVVTDVARMAEIAHGAGALLLCDAVQAFGLLAVDVKRLGADLLTLSGHKVYGPKGVGVLYIRRGLTLPPLLTGGEQERGLRAGTLNTPAVVGMGRAAQRAAAACEADYTELAALQRHFEDRLRSLPGVTVNASDAPRCPKHVSVSIAGADGEALLMNLDRLGVYASAGSACAAGTVEPSHVLLAMGLPRDRAKASVRFSLGRGLDCSTLDDAAGRLEVAIAASRPLAV